MDNEQITISVDDCYDLTDQTQKIMGYLAERPVRNYGRSGPSKIITTSCFKCDAELFNSFVEAARKENCVNPFFLKNIEKIAQKLNAQPENIPIDYIDAHSIQSTAEKLLEFMPGAS